jgi:hypothetical protein
MDWPPTYPLVRVDWIDAHTFTGWNRVDVLEEKLQTSRLEQNVTVGYLYRSEPEAVIIVQSVTDDEQYAEATRIPRGMVKAIHYYVPDTPGVLAAPPARWGDGPRAQAEAEASRPPMMSPPGRLVAQLAVDQCHEAHR